MLFFRECGHVDIMSGGPIFNTLACFESAGDGVGIEFLEIYKLRDNTFSYYTIAVHLGYGCVENDMAEYHVRV